MIERKTVLDQSEIQRSGVLGVRIAFILLEDGAEIDCKWHRTAIPIDADPVAQMAYVNEHLSAMEPSMPQVSQGDIDFIVQCHNLLKQRFEQQ